MSLALPAAILLLLALPGFVFIYFYRGSLRPANDPIVSNETVNFSWLVALGAAGIAHALWVPLADFALHYAHSSLSVDMDAVAYLIAGEYKDGFAEHIASFTRHPYFVLAYFGSIYVVSGVLGAVLHGVVRKCALDRKISLFRFNNEWHYLFFADARVRAVLVTVTCRHNDHTSLYAGLLDTFAFNSDGELERLVVIGASRAQLTPNSGTPPVFTPIDGDKFLIWCRDINTLNLAYLRNAPPPPVPAPALTPTPAPARRPHRP